MKNGSIEDDEVDIFSFILRLRQEKLFIKSEKADIQKLNELIRNKIHTVVKTSWITNKQRFLLVERKASFQNYEGFDSLTSTTFVEAKNALGFQNSIKISNLMQILRSEPKQFAEWLIMGESTMPRNIDYLLILQSIITGLYGGCIYSEDSKLLLTLLFEVAKQQLLTSDNPRRTIKQRTCTFRHLFFLFHEVYQPAKFFLSAALEMPILELVSYNQHYLDVDADKTVLRFRQDDNLKNFKDAIKYRNEVVSKLTQFTHSFIQSMLENVYSFPKPIAWIACHIYKIVEKSFCAKEANAITTELIFTLFICPVIVDPEQYGICNFQVTEIARHNLMQIATILQILALNKFEGIDKKYVDIFQSVDKNSMSNFIELLFFDMDCDEPPVECSPEISRDIMLFSEEELNNLLILLQKVHAMRIQNDSFEKNPSVTVSIEEHLSSLVLSSTDNSPKTTRLNEDSSEGAPIKKVPFSLLGSMGIKKGNCACRTEDCKTYSNVIVFPIDGVGFEYIGLLPEDKVIDLSVPLKNENEVYVPPNNLNCKDNLNLSENSVQSCEVKSNYSNYQDEGSIGNTSDNLEAISEAASNHSVASSLELENEDQNDNLSDMVSANVSGRGSPNISGRDTPSSQVTENDNAENRTENVTQPRQNISRQIRSEIEDKFCKFEIKKLLEGDETISIISETWSTDVLASDNETVELNESRTERPTFQLVDQAIQEVPIENTLDVSETQSESAWSTDVMTSDTERLTEVDNDDVASVAQSDDTNSVPRSDDTRSETDEVGGVRRLSQGSNVSCTNQSTYASNFAGQNYTASVSVNNINYVNVNANIPNYVSSSNSVTNTVNFKSAESNLISINHSYMTGMSFQETKKVDDRVGKKSTQVDSNSNMILKTAVQSISQQTQTSVSFSSTSTNVTTSFSNKVQVAPITDPCMAGPSGLNGKSSLMESDQIFIKRNAKKYEDLPNELLLSNCSLNSSSSGSSSNSFENKNSANENSEQWEPKLWLNSSGSSLNVTLTPSESTSELSVLSMNNLVVPMSNGSIATTGTNKKVPAAINRNVKSSSTGSIAKSISFDMSVDKGLDGERSKRGGFFGKLRNGFKSRRGKSFRNQDDFRCGDDFLSKKQLNDSPVKTTSFDLPDDILAKYRVKPFIEDSPNKTNAEKKFMKNGTGVHIESDINTFSDIKKKLRLVLANTSEIPFYIKRNPCSVKTKLETILRLELGKSRKLRDWCIVARISEALRCINLLDEKRCLKLFHSMKDDIIVRSSYIQYLITSKQQLLFCEMYLDNLQEQIKHDGYQCENYFATICVREFLLEQESNILTFCDEFKQLNLADEKYDVLKNFYHKLYIIMNESPFWHDVLHKRGRLIKLILERYIISRVYNNAIYPNGDGDRDRDRVLREHIEHLSKLVTPEHKDLRIPKIYLRESPWLPAQDALRALDVCRTPKDKLKCILRCAKGIMDLLSLSQNSGSTTADDFTPVLVYVIIKVNPEALLSTIQFVNSFQGQLSGEEQYWWTQFCAAVEFIKTMDYSD
ncbi:GTPase-activating protein and VPS9 domain-containing protein 1 [Cylas formicarius]|uniref:GTPase-activating protein and VPS9 domain-containing protein 1 n=1 Tax=Cylas formicarius TaxID=197179 RepID=UPI0029583303|nr:GTPase-activating protein and VPS9 domain-containing protein 1 [Cylas formicarius]